MNNDIILITSYRDIGRNRWSSIPRSTESYCEAFYTYASRIKYNIIVFVDENTKKYLQTKYLLPATVIFYDIDICETFYHKYLAIESSIINSTVYKQKIPLSRKKCPEHLYAEYNLVNHSKINYVAEAKRLYPNYKFYSWIDFGLRLPDKSKIFDGLNINSIPPKIIYQYVGSNLHGSRMYTLPNREPAVRPDNMLSSDVIYFAGSIFIIHADLVTVYENLYNTALQNLQTSNVVDDDQNVVLQIYLDYKDLFYMPKARDFPKLNIPFGIGEWFKLYEFF